MTNEVGRIYDLPEESIITKESDSSVKLPVIPVGYRILVKQDLVEGKSTSGIILAVDSEIERQQSGHSRGVVMALGPAAYKGDDAKYEEGPWCKVGDRVMFPNYAGKKFKKSELEGRIDKDDKQYWHLMNDEDVLGVVNV